MDQFTGPAIERELINKETGEVIPVLGTAFGDQVVEFTTEEGVIVFENKGRSGDLENELYDVREVEPEDEE
jgi:hypothetical protein